jgi:ATP-binding cassette subfamily B protein/subfamily B ATP-binding cassette protein MsbA
MVKLFKRSLKYMWPYWKLAVVSGLLVLVGSLVGLLGPWPMALLVDHVFGNKPLPWLLQVTVGWLAGNPGALILVAVLSLFFIDVIQHSLSIVDNYVNTKMELSMVLDCRSDLFRHVLRLPMTFHEQRRSGMLIYAINGQAEAVARFIMIIPPLVQSSLILVGMFWISYHLDPYLAWLSLLIVPFLYGSVGYYVKHIQGSLWHVRQMEGLSLSIIHEALMMIRVIVAFGKEPYEYRRFRTQGQEAVNARVRVTVRQALFSMVVNTITVTGTALVLGVGAMHVVSGRLTVGQLLVIMAYIAGVYKPLEQISSTIGSLQDVLVSLRIAFQVMDIKSTIADKPGAREVDTTSGAVAFEEVGFAYEGRTSTLEDVSFQATPGEVVGIVGPTGAGKTTLLSLVPRFYDIHKGRILIDGIDIRDMTLESLRRQISIVLQEPLLFSGTIAENIRYGCQGASDDDVVAAAKAANAHDFIMALPEQYQTELGERGAKLSGGERQRISVARAFLKNAPILILDEPTSSVDSKTEAVILDALDRLVAGRTTFMIAHRLSTIRMAHKLIVLDQGRVVEQGTHDELLAQNGLYRYLYDLQHGAPEEVREVPEEPEEVSW